MGGFSSWNKEKLLINLLSKGLQFFCTTHPNSYQYPLMHYLTCIEGYVLEAKKTCKALGENAALLLANENTLRKIYPYAYHKMVDLHPGKQLPIFLGFSHIFILKVFIDTLTTQRPRTDLNKRFLPRPNTTIAWKLIPHRSNISKIWNPPHWELFY